MRFIFYLLFFCIALSIKAVDVKVTPLKHTKMKLLIAVAHNQKNEIKDIADVLMHDFSFSGQFDVAMKEVKALRTKKDIKEFAAEGFPIIIFISASTDNQHLEWRLYNAVQGKMIKGKRYKKEGSVQRGWAHMIANMIWPELTGQDGFFTSKIAYCKQIERTDKQDYKHIYIADFDGSHEQPIVHNATVNIGPRFNKDMQQCLLFYSQFTDENIELKMSDMHKHSKSISSFEGVNMLPSFSDDGKKVVYCATKGSGKSQIYYFENQKLIQITNNEGNNISPALADEGKKVYFCSDVTKKPSIYCLDRETMALDRITADAPCMSPSYCTKQNRLSYCKKINGIYQVCIYDCKQKKHQQITFNIGQKSESCWSPCGNYILYAVENGQNQSLEIVNVLSGNIQQLAVSGNCSYPTWSICYRELPVVA